eukprot:Plantae.Rhodophyta-Hildenbrandia_rubra.ctg25859.p2 GENE.Plantae.Rhodophyta-Hildenbrandia_rubra.ctg25859~~Plantae.Rhodophyta-Hildenbrandia_rubra.ctg25859.p2  ORF type:complete len:246 (-),score=17.20 Plantae.Rhodophyta-Hildenbrandia_rubra.ctg25859:694-1431(-)
MQIFLSNVTWCGRLISKNGALFDPRNYKAVVEMQPPKTGAELQQLLCAANWMRAAMPECTALTDPLHSFMEKACEMAKARAKKSVARMKLEGIWGIAEAESLEKLKSALKNSITLAHPDDNKALCLFADASDRHWSGVLTQMSKGDLGEPFEEQHHDPLSFLSGSFKGSPSRWSTVEKEAFAIVASVNRLDCMLLRPQGFHLFTDHRNLVFIFSSSSSVSCFIQSSAKQDRAMGDTTVGFYVRYI